MAVARIMLRRVAPFLPAALLAVPLAAAPDALARAPHERVVTRLVAGRHTRVMTHRDAARHTGGVRSQNDVEAAGHASAFLEACPNGGQEAGSGRGQSAGAAVGSATFSARMTQLPGASQMELRFEIFERELGEASFHAAPSVGGSSVGAWRISGEHVNVFKDFDEVTGLAGPAQFRARVRFRWLDSEGRAVDWAAHRTEACREPALVSPPSP